MKKFILMLLLAGFLVPASMSGQETEKSPLLVYYFHNTHRCMTCNAIEAKTKETLDTYFKEAQENGQVKMIVLNAEEKKNRKLTEKYEVWGATLLLVRDEGTEEKVENLTEFAFANARTKPDEFENGLKDHIAKMMQ